MQHCDEYDLLESDLDDDDIDSVRKKLKKLKKLEKTYIERRRQLKERQKQLKKEHRPKHRITLTEPDAPSMRHGNGKSKAPAYNAQLAVDTQTQLIVSNDVTSDRNDFEQFAPQHQRTEKNLGADPKRQFIADSGYHTLIQLDYIDQNQVEALITDPTPENRSISGTPTKIKELLKTGRQLQRADFYFDSNNDCYICPGQHQLSFSRSLKSDGRRKREYCAQPKVCQACALYRQCLPKPTKFGARKILRDGHEALAENMLLKGLTDDAKLLMQLRKTSVEPVFGNLKSNMGFRRFRLRGLDKVKAEFNLMAIAHNLNKLYKFRLNKLLLGTFFRHLFKELIHFFNDGIYFKKNTLLFT
jgi:transposase